MFVFLNCCVGFYILNLSQLFRANQMIALILLGFISYSLPVFLRIKVSQKISSNLRQKKILVPPPFWDPLFVCVFVLIIVINHWTKKKNNAGNICTDCCCYFTQIFLWGIFLQIGKHSPGTCQWESGFYSSVLSFSPIDSGMRSKL